MFAARLRPSCDMHELFLAVPVRPDPGQYICN